MKKDFINSEVNLQGTSGVKPVSWTGIRYMINEVLLYAHVECLASSTPCMELI